MSLACPHVRLLPQVQKVSIEAQDATSSCSRIGLIRCCPGDCAFQSAFRGLHGLSMGYLDQPGTAFTYAACNHMSCMTSSGFIECPGSRYGVCCIECERGSGEASAIRCLF